jgi:paraquat-inducible protein A
MRPEATQTAASSGFVSCHHCLKLSVMSEGTCSLCGARLHGRIPESRQRTIALTLTGALLYIPANVLPIMTTIQLGDPTESTILGGILLLLHHGEYPIAGVIFVASVMVPIAKLLALAWLSWSIIGPRGVAHQQRTRLYRMTELIGKWSMTDVFVIAVLVALIQLGGLLVIRPGPAAVAFGVMVVVTMLAAESFDPRLIWDQEESGDG